ncbi:hypothetical protein L1856_01150 [Streptomyces sp. Tue 6430]|nr:hypothetical protein [Streptomyces sp. Tue 6430]
MAAFQRGMGLAEAQQSLEADAPRARTEQAGPAAADVPHATAPSPRSDAGAHTAHGSSGGPSGGLDHQPTTRHDGSAPAG